MFLVQKRLISEKHFLNMGKGTLVLKKQCCIDPEKKKSFFKRVDLNIKMVFFFFPKAGHTVIRTEPKYRNGDLIEHHTKELYLKKKPKKESPKLLVNFIKMFRSSVSRVLCITSCF